MNASIKIILLLIVILGYSCDSQNSPDKQEEPKVIFAPGQTDVLGTITNEDGEALKGIMVEVFYDELLTHQFPMGGKWPVFTNFEGKYRIGKAGCKSDVKFLYAVATDTTGTYKSNVKQGELVFSYSPIWKDGTQDISSHVTIDFVLIKSTNK